MVSKDFSTMYAVNVNMLDATAKLLVYLSTELHFLPPNQAFQPFPDHA